MAFQVFRADQHPFEVSTLTVDQIPWFKGNEVAACLGYASPRKALRDHVDEEDRKTYAEYFFVTSWRACSGQGIFLMSQPSQCSFSRTWHVYSQVSNNGRIVALLSLLGSFPFKWKVKNGMLRQVALPVSSA